MFRDSFGNAILLFIAEKYGNAFFSRGVPFQINEVFQRGADTVIILRAERFIPEIAENPPVIEALPLIHFGTISGEAYDGARLTEVSKEGYLTKISGIVDPKYLNEKTQIFVRVNGENIYEAFPQCVKNNGSICDSAFSVYLSDSVLTGERNQLEIFAGDNVEVTKVLQTDL